MAFSEREYCKGFCPFHESYSAFCIWCQAASYLAGDSDEQRLEKRLQKIEEKLKIKNGLL